MELRHQKKLKMDGIYGSIRMLLPLFLWWLDFVGGAKDRVPFRSHSRWEVSRISLQRKGYRLTSSYIKSRPEVRYKREYTAAYRFNYDWYYSTYFYHSGTEKYLKRRQPAGSALVCINLEANENGTVMGVFTCPNFWEPLDYTYCCGYTYTEFCCPEKKKYNISSIIGITVGGVVGVFSLGFIVFAITLCIKRRSSDSSFTSPDSVPVEQPHRERHKLYQPASVKKPLPWDQPPEEAVAKTQPASSISRHPPSQYSVVSKGPYEEHQVVDAAPKRPVRSINHQPTSSYRPVSRGTDEGTCDDVPKPRHNDITESNDSTNSKRPRRKKRATERSTDQSTPFIHMSTSV